MYDYKQGKTLLGLEKYQGVWPHGVVGQEAYMQVYVGPENV